MTKHVFFPGVAFLLFLHSTKVIFAQSTHEGPAQIRQAQVEMLQHLGLSPKLAERFMAMEQGYPEALMQQGNKRSSLEFSLDSIVDEENNIKRAFHYDDLGRLVMEENHTIPWFADEMMVTSVSELAYPNDTTTVYTSLYFDHQLDEMVPSWKTTLITDSEQNLIEDLSQSWENGAWLPGFRSVTLYEDGLPILTNLFLWSEDESWEMWGYRDRAFENGLLVLEVGYALPNDMVEDTVMFNRYQYEYDELGREVSRQIELLNFETNVFQNAFFVTTDYDSDEMSITITYASWMAADEPPGWLPTSREIEIKDDLDTGDVLSVYFDNYIDDAWVQTGFREYTHDFDHSFEQIASPEDFVGSKILEEETTWFWDGEVVAGELRMYYYSDFALSASNTFSSEAPLLLFPNPSRDFVQLSGSFEGLQAIAFFDLNGRLVKQALILPQQQLSVADLAAGVYLIQVGEPQKRMQAKLVKW